MEKIDFLIVNPPNPKETYGVLRDELSGIEPPLWCALHAAYIRNKGFTVAIIDAEAENLSLSATAEKIIEINPLLVDMVIMGTNPSASSTPKMSAASILLDALKEKAPLIKTVLTGLHPSALPVRTMRDEKTDFLVCQEGFNSLLKLLRALKNGGEDYEKIEGLCYKKGGEIFSNHPVPFTEELDEIPFAAWDLLPMEKYRAHNWHCFDSLDRRSPYAVIYTTLGCPFKCSYCPIHAFYGKAGLSQRSPENVVGEIDLLVKKYGVRNIKIMDELFVINEKRLERICDLLIARGYDLNIWAYARVDTVKERFLEKMKKAGINWIAYGIESADENVRNGVSKKISQNKIDKAVKMTHAAGINIIGNFMFGLPDDNIESMSATLSMAKNFNFEYVNFYVCMAYPGSRLYDESVRSGVEFPKEWQGWGQYSYECLPLPTKYLKSAEVLKFRDEAFRAYFSNPEYLDMVQKKFGSSAAEHIKVMLKKNIQRRYV
ncbi:B12-binding domain-containing radical SAM protein [bacterium]|nr:B12-binding domain-containing radical SAM protein [bacterium]